MNYFLIGSRGRLGGAIARELSGKKLNIVSRGDYEKWALLGQDTAITNYFNNIKLRNVTIILANGLVDPKADTRDLQLANFEFPKRVVETSINFGFRVVTFGSVLETLQHHQNKYLSSKRQLFEFLQEKGAKENNICHIQLHTLFGIVKPKSFMFLGQILDALLKNEQFKMTSGKQTREYHHFWDDAQVIRYILENQTTGILNLSHGNSIALKDIAFQLFAHFGKLDLLKVGALPDEMVDNPNYKNEFEIPSIISRFRFREPVKALIDHLEEFTQRGKIG